eukprot:SAG31_NODE_485_length_15021_cov_9.439791_8_plen_95_part_00
MQLFEKYGTLIDRNTALIEEVSSFRCINNDRCFLRTSCDVSTLIYKLVDAMIDGVYPLLDVYGDTIENLEFVMMISDGKTLRVPVCMVFALTAI